MAIAPPESGSEDNPVFGAVEEMYVVNSIHVYLYVLLLDTLDYADHFGSYLVRLRVS